MWKKGFDYVFSCGGDCACAMLLRENGLRDMSSPFDWIGQGGVLLEERVRLIEEDFERFLELKNLRKLEKPSVDGDPAHDYYVDAGTGLLHYHDFPVGVPLEECYASVRQKYERRIARFKARMSSGGKVLAVWWDRFLHEDDAAYLNAQKRIQTKYPMCEVHLLAVLDEPEMAVGTMEWKVLSERVVKVSGRFYPISHVCGDRRLAARCLRQIPRSWALRRMALGRLVRCGLANLLSFWHFSREHRKNARRAWRVKLGVMNNH